MAKFLINNTALRNNGDVALIQSLSNALVRNGHQVIIATSYYEYAKQIDVAEAFCSDVTGYSKKKFQNNVLANIAAICKFISDKHYRNCDVILGAPGGYVNSFYGIGWKFKIYKWAKFFGKKTAIYSQSVGPLNIVDQKVLETSKHYLDFLVVRDNYSSQVAIEAGFDFEKMQMTEDAIFLESPDFSTESKYSKTILFSVRQWSYEHRNLDSYILLIRNLVGIVLSRGFRVEFVSTCQGVPGYIDDSTLAKRIVDDVLKENPLADLHIDDSYINLNDLKAKIRKSCFVVGTRLHMCLLAMTSGIPAFNISYEVKGRECYEYLGLSEYSIDYNDQLIFAINKFSQFMDKESEIRFMLPSIIQERHRVSNKQLITFLKKIGV